MSNPATTQTITVAAAQITARPLAQAATSLLAIESAIRDAADRRVDLLVLPECAYPAYEIGSVAAYRAEKCLSSQAFVDWLGQQAAGHRLHLVCGFIEQQGDTLYNAAVLIDDRGRELGRARKSFLWGAEHDWFRPADRLQAFDSPIGRIGMLICADARAPEIPGTLVADGAEILAMPTCWFNHAKETGRYTNPQPEYLVQARAREFGVPFICADKSGTESDGRGYVGQSCIVRADGTVAAAAPPTGETVIAARLTRRPPPRIWMSERRMARLLSASAPVRPTAQPARPIVLAAMPTSVANERFTGGMGETLFKPLQAQGVDLLMVNMSHEQPAEQLAILANAFDLKAIGFPTRADVFALGPAHVGCVPRQWAGRFSTARALSLEGAEILLMFDMPDDVAMLRTRAIENRVFVAGANSRSAIIIDPGGQILAHTQPDHPVEAIAAIDLARAADKAVAFDTDILLERRPSQYRFSRERSGVDVTRQA